MEWRYKEWSLITQDESKWEPMPEPTILPLTGGRFESFLNLNDPASKSDVIHAAWKKIQQDVNLFSERPQIDFNEVFRDVMALEALVYPILEESQKPLGSAEWKRVNSQRKEALGQWKRLDEGLKQVRKNDLPLYRQLRPLLDQLKEVCEETQVCWKNYESAWLQFQAQEAEQKEREDAQRGVQQTPHEDAPTSPSEEQPDAQFEEEKKKLTSPSFNRVRWHVLRLSVKALILEIRYRGKRKQPLDSQDDVPDYPIFKILVEEVQNIYRRTEGFELLEKVKLVQRRNSQIAKILQPYYTEGPVLSESLRSSQKPSRENTAPVPNPQTTSQPAKQFNRKKWALLLLLLLFLPIGGIVIYQQVAPTSTQERSSFVQKKSSFSFTSVKDSLLSFGGDSDQTTEISEIQQSLQANNVDLSVYPLSDKFQSLAEATSVPSEIKQALAEAKETVMLVASESAAYLVSQESLLRFDSLEELDEFLESIREQYQQFLATIEILQDRLTQYEISLEATSEEGIGNLTLIMRDANGDIAGRINLGVDGWELRWQNLDSTQVVNTPEELAEVIEQGQP